MAPRVRTRYLGALFLAVLSYGCATGASRPDVELPETPSPCLLFPQDEVRQDPLSVGLSQPVDPAHAPVPRNSSEELVFRQLYETLVRVDCQGRIQPGLATRWEGEDGGRRWILRLRDDVFFWDETPVRVADVLESWADLGPWDPLAPQVPAPFESVRPLGPNLLSVELRHPQPDAPRVLAHPRLAVARRDPSSAWPLGTGPYRVASPGVEGTTADGIRLFPHRGGAPALVFRAAVTTDFRDLLDQGVDVVVTRSPEVVDYARNRPQLVAHPLPWTRILVLASPQTRWTGTLAPSSPVDDSWLPWREALARDAVRGDARGAGEHPWWMQARPCPGGPRGALRAGHPATAEASGASGRIVYLEGDEDARDVAGRLVALAFSGTSDGPQPPVLSFLPPRDARTGGLLQATGLSSRDLAAALRDGREGAYILDLPSGVLSPCHELELVLSRAEWLAQGLADDGGAGVSLVPLVETRPWLVSRHPLGGVEVDWDGTLLFSPRSPRQR